MNEIYARICDNYIMRGWADHPFILLDRYHGSRVFDYSDYEYVVNSCNGTCDFSSPAFLPIHRAQLKELVENGFVQYCDMNEQLSEVQKYVYIPCPMLKEINWAITDRCNLNCIHCFMDSPNKTDNDSLENIDYILSEIINTHVPIVTLTGGEPLLSPYFKHIVSSLSEAGIKISQISTNATLLSKDILNFLMENEQYPDLLISFDGVGAHDVIRGKKGIESVVLKNICNALDIGFACVIVTTLMQENIDTLMHTYDILKDLSPSGWFINRAQSLGLYTNEKRLTTKEIADAVTPLCIEWKKDNKPFPLVIEKFCSIESKTIYTFDSPECAGNKCVSFLLPDGTLMPCQGYVGTVIQNDMPNIMKEGLINSWTSPALGKFRNADKSERANANSKCQACDNFGECGMGCRAFALSQTGNILNPDPDMCELYSQGWRTIFNEMLK